MSQHMEALQRANEIRFWRSVRRARIRSLPTADGMAEVALLIAAPPDVLETMLVRSLLKWPARGYASKITEAMRYAGISEFRTVGDLTPRQRDALAAELRERWPQNARAAA